MATDHVLTTWIPASSCVLYWFPPCFSPIFPLTLLYLCNISWIIFPAYQCLPSPQTKLINKQTSYYFIFKFFFKSSIEFITILLLFYVFWSWGMWDPKSLTREWTCTPCIGKRSLNHWTTREVPQTSFQKREKGGITHQAGWQRELARGWLN